MKKLIILFLLLGIVRMADAQRCRSYVQPRVNQWVYLPQPVVYIQSTPVIIVPPRVVTVLVYINGAGGNWIDQYTSLWYVNAYYPAWQIAAWQRNSSVVTWACWTRPVQIQPQQVVTVPLPTNPFLMHPNNRMPYTQ